MQQDAEATGEAAGTPPERPPVPDPGSEEPAEEHIEIVPGEPESEEEEILEAQVGEWKELAMRATADLENFRKRMAREKSDAVRYGNQSLLMDLLPVLDNFEIGLQAAASEEESMIYQGMAMVKKQLDDFLASQGVQIVQAVVGEPFNLDVHEAVSQEESNEVEEGAIVRVMRRGYRMHERLLRPANVVVAKAPEPAGEK